MDLTEMVESVVTVLRTSMPAQVRLHCSTGTDPVPVHGDAAQLRQVIINLITNGRDALQGSAGTLEVELVRRTVSRAEVAGCTFQADSIEGGEYGVLAVNDTGHGMAPEVLSQIFDPFFTTKGSHRGLGLAAASGIVRSHGGALRVTSTPGVGSGFELFLPVSSDAPTARPEKTSQSAISERAGGTILVADDDDLVLQSVLRILKRKGYRTLAASDGAQALQTYRQHQNELSAVILDLSMPGLHGIEVHQAIRRERDDLPIILCSGFSEEEVQKESLDPRTRFVGKPYRPSELLNRIQELQNLPSRRPTD